MKRLDALERALPAFGSRREFLTRLAEVGGYATVFSSMHALGLMTATPAEGEELRLQPGAGNGVKVAILGGGIAGLVSAYELGKAGYNCTVLEARSRPGGRNWTVRGGTKVEFTDGMVQTGEWGPDNYLNAGPARLPSIHKTILGYCNELGVPLTGARSAAHRRRSRKDARFPENLRRPESRLRLHGLIPRGRLATLRRGPHA